MTIKKFVKIFTDNYTNLDNEILPCYKIVSVKLTKKSLMFLIRNEDKDIDTIEISLKELISKNTKTN